MATYNNPHWLLSHIRNSFIATDDTGMCEQVMLSEDLPNQLANNTNLDEMFYCYPGLENSEADNEEDIISNSYEIQMDQNIGFHRQRSNTAQKLERMEQARKRAAKIKVIKVDDSTVQLLTIDIDNKLFQRKNLSQLEQLNMTSSLLSYQIENCPQQPHNQFLEFARFDGTAQKDSVMFKVFLTMIPQRKNYPLPICISGTARIFEFIGLICYKTSVTIPNSEQLLRNIENFGLFIAEENGEVELGFPCLDKKELCSRFRFTYLSLVECNPNDQQVVEPSISFSTSEAENASTFLNEIKNQQMEDVVLLTGHITDIEAPLYKIYKVNIISRSLPIFRSTVQLGISGEKIEIDPERKSKIWVGQRAVSYKMDSIALCEEVETKGNKSIFRIIYCVDKAQKQLLSNNVGTKPSINLEFSSSPTQSSTSPTNEFNSHSFETTVEMANEIVLKINKILDLRSNSVRKKYLESKEKRKFRVKRPFT